MVKSNERPPLSAVHRTKLIQLRDQAADLAGAALKMVQSINEVLEQGGAVNVQPQMAYFTISYARMTKDWGAIEHLQTNAGVVQRKPPQVR